MSSTAIALFWAALLSLAYGYAGYPLLVIALGALRGRRVRRAPVTPRVSVVIAAFDEEDVIGERLENVLSLDYPAGSLEIIVASDGSRDATESIVAGYADRGVRLLRLPRRGKVPALNDAVAHASGEILIFSDANISFEPTAVRMLVRGFADPEVGGVAGDTRYRIPSRGQGSARGEGLYWRYDTWLKEMESRTGSIVSAHGGIYAVRRELFRPLPETSVTDDFAISTGVVEQGRRLVFDREAVAYELAIGEADREFRRKVRLMTRAWRSVLLRRRLLNPFRYGFYSVVLFSHKVLRRLLPISLLVLVGSSLLLVSAGEVYVWAAVGQLAFYALAGLGYLARGARPGRRSPLFIPFYYCMANAAALVALARFLGGDRIELWQPQRHAARA